MQCRYCQEWNPEDERRCNRCGRRLRVAADEPYPLTTATAPQLHALPGGEPLASAPPEHVSFQPSLFRDASGGPKVIPIPTLVPVQPAGREDATAPRRSNRASTPRPRARRVPDSQQSLEFYDSQNTVRTPAQPEAVIYCDAPVALPAHRVIAAAFDASMVLIAVGVFLSIFFLSGGMLVLSKQNAPFLFLVVLIFSLFYRLLWCLGNGDTPGTRFAGLKLVDFDGRPPDREQRGLRQVASLLSLFSVGLGLVWALVDEEQLTWHDHISKTFPTSG